MSLPQISRVKTDDEKLLLRLKNIAHRDLFFFAKYIVGFKDMKEGLHDKLAKFISNGSEAEIKKIILWPRGTFKTSMAMAYILWRLIHNPAERILIYSADLSQARKRHLFLKEQMESNKLLKGLWPEIFYQNPAEEARIWTNRALSVRSDKFHPNASIEIGSVESNITGDHYSGVLVDDAENDETTSSDLAIDGLIQKWQLLRPVLDPKSWEMIVGTIWHHKGLHMWLVENQKQFEVERRSIFTHGTSGKIQSLFPEILPMKKIRELQDSMSRYLFSCHYENSPVGSQGATFTAEQIEGAYYDVLPNVPMNVTITCDPAWTTSKKSDQSAITALATSPSKDCYVLTAWQSRVLVKELVKKLLDTAILYRSMGFSVTKIGIEAQGAQASLKYELEDEMRRRGEFFSITNIGHGHTSKNLRITALEPMFSNSKIHLRRNMNELVGQLLRFDPDKKNNKDDLLDSLAMHLELGLMPSVNYAIVNSPDSWQATLEQIKEENKSGDSGFLGSDWRQDMTNDPISDWIGSWA